MKYTLLALIVLIFGCSSKRPKVYPDLYSENLLMNQSFKSALYKEGKVYWIHNFKKVAVNGFSTSKQIALAIDATALDMAKSCLTDKFYSVADSLGKAAALNKTNLKFNDIIYFYDSAFLDSVTLRNYKLYKKDIRTLNTNQPKVNRRSDEH